MPPTPCNLTLNPFQFQVVYAVNGESSPTFQVFPQIATLSPFNPSPFNFENTPFLIPSAAESFGFNTQAISESNSGPVYWQVTIRYFKGSGMIIVSPGGPSQPFDSVSGNVGELLNPGETSALVGFTAFSAQNAYVFKPGDLPLDTPVRLEITLSAFADSGFTQMAPEIDPSDNVLSFWVMRCGGGAAADLASVSFNPQPDPPG